MIKKILQILKKIYIFFNKKIIKIEEISQVNSGEILKGKNILITGGTSGIGYSIAKKCLSEGAIVTITGRDVEKLNEIKKKLNSTNLKVLVWDIRDISIIDSKIKDLVNLIQRVDVVFNNAGIYLQKDFFKITEEEYENILNTNLKSVFFISQKFANYFVENDIKGIIINIASIRGYQGASEPYGISKWGVRGLTKGLAKELIKYGIRVNAIAPGITASLINGINPAENAYCESTLDKRVALSQEIAEIAVFLASDTSKHIIGEVIKCDGGETLI